MAFQKRNVEIVKAILLFIILLLLWPIVQHVVLSNDITAGYVDPSILVLIVLAMICFLGILFLSWVLLRWFWRLAGLPGFNDMVLQFDELSLCVRLGFYFGCFCLAVFAGVGCLIAIV